MLAGMAARYGREVKTLAQARREFARKRSPWIIAAGVAALVVARIALGGFGMANVIAAAIMLAVYPLGEWAIHLYLLHWRPRAVGGRQVDPAAARAHREHHADPANLSLIALAPGEVAQLLLLAVPATVGVIAAAWTLFAGGPALSAMVSAALVAYLAVGAYEWAHFLIHTAYRPRSRYYRAIWRNHRLHHFKNERFWHGITNDLSDRLLGTAPDQRDVQRSATARDLGVGPAP
jgi:Fatty acid hydroxylase superfamily